MKINIKNIEKLTLAINEAEGRAQVRTITPKDVNNAIEHIEAKLGHILPKKQWQGLKFTIDPNAQTFPAAYNNTPMSTQVIIERGSTAWFAIYIARGKCVGPTKWIEPFNIELREKEIIDFLDKATNWS